MSLPKIKGNVIPFWMPRFGAAGANVVLLDAAGEKAGFVFRIPKTGTITKLGFRTGTVTTGVPSPGLDIRLETVDLATGNPSGTLWAVNTNGSQIVADTDDNIFFVVTLTAGASVTIGQNAAIVVEIPAGGSGNLNIVVANGGFVSFLTYPSVLAYTIGVWVKQGLSLPQIAYIEYSDGSTEWCGLYPITNLNTIGFNSGSNPDERGNIFQVPFPCRIMGACANIYMVAGSDFDIVLYDANNNILESISVDGDLQPTTANRSAVWLFDTPVELLPNTNYRLVVKPTTVNNVTLNGIDVGNASHLDAFELGQLFYRTTRVDAGSWTNTTTGRECIWPLFDAFARPRARVF